MLRYRHFHRILLWVLTSGGLALSGCDSTPGPAPVDDRPPVVSNLAYSPQRIDLSEGAYQVQDSMVTFPLVVQVTAGDPDGDVSDVVYQLQSVAVQPATLASGPMTPIGEGRYEASTPVSLPISQTGNYTLTVYAVDMDGRLGNQVRGSVALVNSSHPPVVVSVEAIPSVIRPPYPIDFTLIATVSDPDGLGNVARVEGHAPNGSIFALYDDGVSFGDQVRGDGKYTASFTVDDAAPGVQVFTIQAFDRAGLSSPPFQKEVTVE